MQALTAPDSAPLLRSGRQSVANSVYLPPFRNYRSTYRQHETGTILPVLFAVLSEGCAIGEVFFELVEKDEQSNSVTSKISLVIFANRKAHIKNVLAMNENAFELKDGIDISLPAVIGDRRRRTISALYWLRPQDFPVELIEAYNRV